MCCSLLVVCRELIVVGCVLRVGCCPCLLYSVLRVDTCCVLFVICCFVLKGGWFLFLLLLCLITVCCVLYVV